MSNEQSPIKEIWEKVKSLFGIVFMGFLFGISLLIFLAILLQWTIGIDITEFGNTYRLLFLFWGVCAVGWHLYLKNQEEKKIQEQLDKLKRKEIVYNPRPGLMERHNQEQKDSEELKKYTEKKREIETNQRSNNPLYLSDKFNPNYQDLMAGRELKEEANPSQNQNTNPQQQPEEGEWEVLVKPPQDVDEPSPKQPKVVDSKRLIFLISTEGKTLEEVKQEGWKAFQKYEQVKAQVESQLNPPIPSKRNNQSSQSNEKK